MEKNSFLHICNMKKKTKQKKTLQKTPKPPPNKQNPKPNQKLE